MDIAGLSTALAMSKTQYAVGAKMIEENLDMMETLGEGMADMIGEVAADPNVGGSVDIRV